MIDATDNEYSQTCQRCGTCCRQGGPALHGVDKNLVMQGIIPLKDLFTIRPGEFVSNQIKKVDEPTPEEIIKIKGLEQHSWSCRYFNASQNSCRIYSTRPLECRILKCWDTQAIESAYLKERLSRRDLLSSVPGLMELIEFHQDRCNQMHLNSWIKNLSHKSPAVQNEAQKELLECIHWDLRLRELAPQKTHIDPEQLDFIFGRPINNVLKMRGWKIHQDRKDKFCLRAITF